MHTYLYCFRTYLSFILPALLPVFSFATITQCEMQHVKYTSQNTSHKAASKQTLTFQIIPAEANTFGYDILSDNKKLIHQPSRPGLPGNRGFVKKHDAEKVATLVIHKLNHNIMPPTVKKNELDSLKVSL